MKIKELSVKNIVLSVVALSSALAAATEINPLVPFGFKAGDPAAQVAAMKTLREKFGLNRFVFTAPGHWRLVVARYRRVHDKARLCMRIHVAGIHQDHARGQAAHAPIADLFRVRGGIR